MQAHLAWAAYYARKGGQPIKQGKTCIGGSTAVTLYNASTNHRVGRHVMHCGAGHMRQDTAAAARSTSLARTCHSTGPTRQDWRDDCAVG